MTFHTKCLWVQYHFVLGSVKQMDLLKVMVVYLVLFGHSWYDEICDKIR